jgi:hypothetical protein
VHDNNAARIDDVRNLTSKTISPVGRGAKPGVIERGGVLARAALAAKTRDSVPTTSFATFVSD